MNRGRFEKVTLGEYAKARRKMPGGSDITDGRIRQEYDTIKYPSRATMCSAGYDIGVPYDVNNTLVKNNKILLPTGLRWVSYDTPGVLTKCELFVRSSTGTKKGVVLANGTGIIDSDYFMADNEGHIYICLCRNGMTYDDDTDTSGEWENFPGFEVNEGIAQAIFSNVEIIDEEPPRSLRVGGFGSTTNR